ncbi:hypothetical protein [Actinomadura rubrisoli]|uniref:Uncharacterized protein n=1 Tax=Actinomadura rubrisoli TaxID=2530368 RepID=A0A4R5CDY2_9ACTN|nr:hypothetical protein [Actinomadura rubrisoli]TDD97159.1 hypothetical protein E1298_01610 [Actinomadura rubrisoli]
MDEKNAKMRREYEQNRLSAAVEIAQQAIAGAALRIVWQAMLEEGYDRDQIKKLQSIVESRVYKSGT